MQKNIALIYGDCSSPEIVTQAVRVLDKIAAKHGHTFTYTRAYMGGEAIDKFGDPLPQSELDKCLASDSVLLGAVGGPKWDSTDPNAPRPEQGLLRIRKGLGLYTNLRPVKIYDALAGASTLRPEVIKGVDLVIVRELTGGLYFGRRERFYDEEGAGTDGAKGQRAYDTLEYREYEVERIARQAFEAARKRRARRLVDEARGARRYAHAAAGAQHRLAADAHVQDLPLIQRHDRKTRRRAAGGVSA